MVALTFIAVVVSTVNFLEVTPLFFLGSTLMFIGFDLLYEWIVEVRHKVSNSLIGFPFAFAHAFDHC